VAQTLPNASRTPFPSSSDALTAVLLFAGLAALFALTRSHWLDDWDSVNFAFALDDFDVMRHRPHPPGYPLYIAAGKLAHLAIANHASALTFVSSLSGAAVASMFYLLDRRQNDWQVALWATLIMALSPLYWLQSGLALTDMFGMVFVLAFLLVEGTTPATPRGILARRIACGVIAGTELLQVKSRPYDLQDLFGDSDLVRMYQGGCYATLRLTAGMYHRFHAPHDCLLETVAYHPGELWNVNPVALRRIDKLFCRNERAVLRMRLAASDHPITLVPVAAILVAGIRLHCLNRVLDSRERQPAAFACDATFRKGEEVGWFQHGSTVLVFAPDGFSLYPAVEAGAVIRMGQPLMRLP